jgi:hypothetical protein
LFGGVKIMAQVFTLNNHLYDFHIYPVFELEKSTLFMRKLEDGLEKKGIERGNG